MDGCNSQQRIGDSSVALRGIHQRQLLSIATLILLEHTTQLVDFNCSEWVNRCEHANEERTAKHPDQWNNNHDQTTMIHAFTGSRAGRPGVHGLQSIPRVCVCVTNNQPGRLFQLEHESVAHLFVCV